LIELIVVSLIICVLVGVIIPGVLASHGAAERIRCLNNMRQVSLGLQNYNQQYQCFPPGVVNPTGPIHNQADGLHLGWIVQLLPFMEQSGLSMAFDPRISVYDPLNQRAAGTRLSSLICTSDKNSGNFRGLSVSSYAACHHDVEAPIDKNNHGVFFLNSHVTIDDIEDGTSNTLFFGEKRITAPDLGWVSGTRATLRNTGTPINSSIHGGSEFVGGFSSMHAGGANLSFGDGSVRFVKETIDMNVYRLLGHRADGEPVSDNAF
jgi:prepilin-type processing-associated H-X9-DG protein